jgi:hypothetical protein
MERYYAEQEGPLLKKYRKILIPFALRFYKDLTESTFMAFKEGVNFFKTHYPSKSLVLYLD